MAGANISLRAELENRIRFETLISDISARFIKLSSGEVDSEIEFALRQILDFFEIDRCGVLGVSEDKKFVWVTHICYAEGIEEVSKDINLAELFPWGYERLIIRGLPIILEQMTGLPPEAEQDRLSWLAMGVKSNLTIPLFCEQGVRHLLAIQSLRNERAWPKEFIPRLNLLGEIFVNALERKSKDHALNESQLRLNLAADAAGAGLWTLDVSTGVFWVTEKTRELLGFSSNSEIAFEQFLNVVHPDDRERIRQVVNHARQSKEEVSVQYRIVYPDGSVRWIASRGRIPSGESADMNLLMGVSIDITERKRTEEKLLTSQKALRSFASKLLTAQEEERRRLARELHDDLSQRLAVLAIETSKLEKQAGPGSTLKQIKEQLIKISTDVHGISRQLHPSIVEDLGLVDAMNSECLAFSKRENMTIQFQQEKLSLRVPRDVAICFYRILQEALRNIKKHAETSRAEVMIFGDGGDLVLRISDHGVGFDLEKAHHKAGLGLISMEERATLIKGEFKIKSQAGKGTMIELRVPLMEK